MTPENYQHQRHATNHVNPQNPIFQREEVKVPAFPSLGQAAHAQTGDVPQPTTESPLLNERVEEFTPPATDEETVQEASSIGPRGTVYYTSEGMPASVSDGKELVPIDSSLMPGHISTDGTISMGHPLVGNGDEEGEEDDDKAGPQLVGGTAEAPTQGQQAPAGEEVPAS